MLANFYEVKDAIAFIRFMARFGPHSAKVFEKADKVLNSIFLSAKMLATYYWQRQVRVHMEPDEFQKHLDEMHKNEGVFWDTLNENDDVRKQLSAIQIELERITEPCFKEQTQMYSWFTRKLFK